jgi:hypothetical protein
VPAVTIMEQVDQIMDAMFGPSRYADVDLLNRVADKLSDEGFAIACTDPVNAYKLLQISCELGERAQALDKQLVNEIVQTWEANRQ